MKKWYSIEYEVNAVNSYIDYEEYQHEYKVAGMCKNKTKLREMLMETIYNIKDFFNDAGVDMQDILQRNIRIGKHSVAIISPDKKSTGLIKINLVDSAGALIPIDKDEDILKGVIKYGDFMLGEL